MLSKLIGLTLIATGFAVGQCTHGNVTYQTVTCACTGGQVQGSACAGTDSTRCTQYAYDVYCGSNGVRDCYIGQASVGCTQAPVANKTDPLMRKNLIDRASIRKDDSIPICSKAALANTDTWWIRAAELGR